MQNKLYIVVENSSKVGLRVKISKTKTLRVNSNNTKQLNIFENSLVDVDDFFYLGRIITSSGGSKEDVAYGIAKDNQAYGALNKVWKSNHITLRTKIKFFNSNVKLV